MPRRKAVGHLCLGGMGRMRATCRINPSLKASWQARPHVRRMQLPELQMNILRDVSVRTILAGVFVLFAACLCVTLGWQLYGAWDESATAQRAAALAQTDKAVFAATYDLRQQRTDLQTFFQTPR